MSTITYRGVLASKDNPDLTVTVALVSPWPNMTDESMFRHARSMLASDLEWTNVRVEREAGDVLKQDLALIHATGFAPDHPLGQEAGASWLIDASDDPLVVQALQAADATVRTEHPAAKTLAARLLTERLQTLRTASRLRGRMTEGAQ